MRFRSFRNNRTMPRSAIRKALPISKIISTPYLLLGSRFEALPFHAPCCGCHTQHRRFCLFGSVDQTRARMPCRLSGKSRPPCKNQSALLRYSRHTEECLEYAAEPVPKIQDTESRYCPETTALVVLPLVVDFSYGYDTTPQRRWQDLRCAAKILSVQVEQYQKVLAFRTHLPIRCSFRTNLAVQACGCRH